MKSIDEYLFSFVHDRIQQASYSMIGENQAKEYHYAIGIYIHFMCSKNSSLFKTVYGEGK